MARFDSMKGIFGLLPTPYKEDLEIHTDDLKKVADFYQKIFIVLKYLQQQHYFQLKC